METQVNGVRVVYRDRFPARQGWDLLKAVRRVDQARRKALDEARDADDFMGALLEVLTFEEITTFVQGAVETWDFPGDLKRADCLEALDPLTELLPLVTSSVLLFYTANNGRMSGEAGGGSTVASEG